jgi:hypothetical protein
MKKLILVFRTLWSKLKNGEYAAANDSLNNKIGDVEPRINNPGFTERAAKYQEEYGKLDAILKPQRKAKQSSALKKAEKDRDKHLSFIAKTVDSALKYLPESPLYAAALVLDPIIANFKGLKGKGVMDESGLGLSYIEDFDKPEIKAAIAVLNLDEIVAAFRAANELYISLWNERAQDYANKLKKGSVKDARKRLDTALDDLASYSNALYMAGSLPSINQTALGEWIDFANAQILSYARLLTQRGKKVKYQKPDIDNPDIGNPTDPQTPDISNPPAPPFE